MAVPRGQECQVYLSSEGRPWSELLRHAVLRAKRRRRRRPLRNRSPSRRPDSNKEGICVRESRAQAHRKHFPIPATRWVEPCHLCPFVSQGFCVIFTRPESYFLLHSCGRATEDGRNHGP